MKVVNFEIIVESGEGYKLHYPDDEEAIRIAENQKQIVAFY